MRDAIQTKKNDKDEEVAALRQQVQVQACFRSHLYMLGVPNVYVILMVYCILFI